MAEVITFERYRPVARYDSVPWTQAKIYEAPTSTGAWVLIDTKTLSPTDADPSDPATRSFTTALGTAPNLWYHIVFNDAGGGVTLPTAPVQNADTSNRDLCTFGDVMLLVPGYQYDSDTDQLINELISSESVTAHDLAGREFMTVPSSVDRNFDIDARVSRQRIVPVGDMTTVTTVTVKDIQGATVQTVNAADYVKLPRNRQEWEPIVELWFPKGTIAAAPLGSSYVLNVVGVWGFPLIPADVRVAVAKMVLVRYLADAAASGTALSDAANELGFDAGQAFASAMDTMRSYQTAVFA